VSDVNDVIEAAIGGKQPPDLRGRAPLRVGGAPAEASATTSRRSATSGERAGRRAGAAGEPGDIRVDGPAQISRELAKRRVVVAINVKDRDLGGFVAELQKTAPGQAARGLLPRVGRPVPEPGARHGPPDDHRAGDGGAIFFLLFLLFNSLAGQPDHPGAAVCQCRRGDRAAVTGEYLSVPASVGFIALWGIAVLNGVVLVSYIRTCARGHALAEAVVQGATQRFRPVMMTATVALLALIPSCSPPGRAPRCSAPGHRGDRRPDHLDPADPGGAAHPLQVVRRHALRGLIPK
jgi:cobalt-zinc-cadmium resistance protein CzcA